MVWMQRPFFVLVFALGLLPASVQIQATEIPNIRTREAAPFLTLAQIVVAGEAKTWDSRIQLDTYVDELVYAVGAEHGWTPKNALWPEVAARVRTDIDKHPDLFFQTRREATTQGYAKSYAMSLTARQADDVATLYQSEAGQKYLAFSADVLNFYLTVMRRARDEGQPGALREVMVNALKAPPAKDERVLLAAGTRYLVSAMGDSRSKPPGAQRLTLERMNINMVARAAPSEWNALFARYEHDMNAIEQVANDPLAQLEMDHSSDYRLTPANVPASIQAYLASWKAFYWTAKAKRIEAPANP
ncbi:hypothetical protein [Dyella jiangningensis]|uniref:DUF3829 domain-containing protein n=1 Tax=Dyella jiangningensis TaxID=1379159 RepID=A0A328NZG2_9GAMM|nr:hypothetical protein [Dyella jiangningensis]RAO74601.1 hypothetical protein CA260_19645 [Dyella jiangningensis]